MSSRHSNERRCLFVASGPSAPLAWRYRGWGDLVTLNRAIQLFEHVDLALFGSGNKLRDTQEHWHKAELIGALFGPNDPLASWEGLVPPEKLIQLPLPMAKREGKGRNRLKVVHEHIQSGYVLGRAGVAVTWLNLLGYNKVWLFGHDGGHDYAESLRLKPSRRGYDKPRFCTAEVLKYLKMRHAFWPDILE